MGLALKVKVSLYIISLSVSFEIFKYCRESVESIKLTLFLLYFNFRLDYVDIALKSEHNRLNCFLMKKDRVIFATQLNRYESTSYHTKKKRHKNTDL